MAIVGTMEKQPAEVLDYDVDFSAWIPADDFITSAAATVTPSGLTIDSTSVFDGSWVKVWISGGTNAVKYKVQITVTTDDGRVKECEFFAKIREV